SIVGTELQPSPEDYLRFVPSQFEDGCRYGEGYICFRAVLIQSQCLQDESPSYRSQSKLTKGASEDGPGVRLAQRCLRDTITGRGITSCIANTSCISRSNNRAQM